MDNVAGDEDHYGRVFVTTQGRGIPYGEPGTPNTIDKAPLTFQHQLNGLKFLGSKVIAEGIRPMQLLDVRGRVVRQAMPVGNKVEIDLKGLTRGAYIARCGDAVLLIGLSE
jgi:hypothetical protein